MNILITGAQASGKSTTALALKKFYEGRGGFCEILEDEPCSTQAEMTARRQIVFKRMASTKSSSNFHTVCVTQEPPPTAEELFSRTDLFNPFDYVIKCEAM